MPSLGTILYHPLEHSYAIPWNIPSVAKVIGNKTNHSSSSSEIIFEISKFSVLYNRTWETDVSRSDQTRSDRIRSVITLHFNFDTLVLWFRDGSSISKLECSVPTLFLRTHILHHPFPSHLELSHVMQCHVMLCHFMLCHAIPCHAISFHAMSCYAMPSHAMPSR